jgi:hypothetical protein
LPPLTGGRGARRGDHRRCDRRRHCDPDDPHAASSGHRRKVHLPLRGGSLVVTRARGRSSRSRRPSRAAADPQRSRWRT